MVRLHETAPLPWMVMASEKWVALLSVGVFTCDGAGADALGSVVTIDGMPWSLGSVPIFCHGNDTIHSSGSVTVSFKRTLIDATVNFLNGTFAPN